jgi:hypothetical protein
MSAFDQMQNRFNVVGGVGGDENERHYQRERKRNYNVNLSYAQHAESSNLQSPKPTLSYGFRQQSERLEKPISFWDDHAETGECQAESDQQSDP